MLRDGGARVLDGDEAYTIVEAEIDNLPAALREIKRLRTELAARPPAPPWLGRRTPAEEAEAAPDADADDADADDKTEDARGGASDDDADDGDRGTKRRADDGDAAPPEAKRRAREPRDSAAATGAARACKVTVARQALLWLRLPRRGVVRLEDRG